MTIHRRRRIPKLRFIKLRGIGWHVAFRDSNSKSPRRVRFGNIDKAEAEAEAEAEAMYHA